MAVTSAVASALAGLAARDSQVVGYSEDEIEEVREGRATGRRGIRIFVENDEAATRMPSEIGGVPVVEVRSVGPAQDKSASAPAAGLVGVDPKTKVRPVIGGISVGAKETGTLGYFVVIGTDRYVLTCAHVVPAGDDVVIQPGPFDGGKPADKIATVTKRVMNGDAGVDAAAAKLSAESTLDLNNLGKVTGAHAAAKGEKVKKSGRTTGVTEGEVIDVNFTWANAPQGPFKHQIVVEAKSGFSQGGDSGSLVVTTAKLEAVGLLKGGGATVDYVNPIDRVLAELGAKLAT